MNISELFFYKVLPCPFPPSSLHKESLCYFNHNPNGQNENLNDIRRPLLNFQKALSSYQNISIRGGNLIGYNASENKLEYYSENYSFEERKANEILFRNFSPCKNKYEYLYHINRYTNNKCNFETIGLKCPLNNLCYDKHNNNFDKADNSSKIIFDSVNDGIKNFRNFIELIKKKDNFIYLYNIVQEYKIILDTQNRFIKSSQHDSMKGILISFQVFLSSYYTSNPTQQTLINSIQNENRIDVDTSSSIIQQINNKSNNYNIPFPNQHLTRNNLVSQTNKIEINVKDIKLKANFYSTFHIESNLCYCSSIPPKKEEITKVVYAMLNCHDGYVLYGVDINSEEIQGFQLLRKERDKFQCWFNAEFEPILIEFEDNIKYKFYEIDVEKDIVLLVIYVKKVKNEKLISDWNSGKCFIIKNKFLQKFESGKLNKIFMGDIKQVNLKEYIEILRIKFIEHYSLKFSEKKQIDFNLLNKS